MHRHRDFDPCYRNQQRAVIYSFEYADSLPMCVNQIAVAHLLKLIDSAG